MSTKKTDSGNTRFAEKIKSVRKERGLTQDDLAKVLGVTKGYVSKIEKGEQEPSQPLKILLDRWVAGEWGLDKVETPEEKLIEDLKPWGGAGPDVDRAKFNQDMNGLFSIIMRWQEEENGADPLTSMQFIQLFHERIPELGEWIKKRKGSAAQNSPPENLSAANGES